MSGGERPDVPLTPSGIGQYIDYAGCPRFFRLKYFDDHLVDQRNWHDPAQHSGLFAEIGLSFEAEQLGALAETATIVVGDPESDGNPVAFDETWTADLDRDLAADAIAALLGEDYETGAYRLGKYRRSSREVTLRDTVNRVHVHAYADIEDGSHRDRLLTQLMEGDLDEHDAEPLDSPGTWENVISERGNTADAWRVALDGDAPGVSRGMGIMARVRNVRNMLEAGLDGEEIFGEAELERVERSRMFPFRLFTAYRAYRAAAVQDAHVEEFLETAIQRLVENVPDTWSDAAVGIDLSGSMQHHSVSEGSVVTAADIACFFGGIAMNKGAHAAAFGWE